MGADPGIRILIVDDQDTVLEILRSLLRKLGFRNIDTAKDGNEALERMKKAIFRYGLVISDWNMQPMTGLELLESLRNHPRLAKTPFIMITGENTKDRVLEAMDAGVTSYITKPFSAEAVKRRLVSVLGEF